MAESGDAGPPGPRTAPRAALKRAVITGTALVIPILLTLVVLQLALGVIAQIIAPLVTGLQLLFGVGASSALVLELTAVLTLVGLILAVGVAAEYRQAETGLSRGFDALMARIPGLGSVYTGIRGLSEVVLEQDTESFKAVKLVEFPREESYMLGFLTAEPPESVTEAAGHDAMQTLFIPLAPNPVMGGFLVNLPDARVHEVDISVEEGVQAIVTSGAAIDPRIEDAAAGGPVGLSGEDLPSVSDLEDSLREGELLDGDGLLPGEQDE